MQLNRTEVYTRLCQENNRNKNDFAKTWEDFNPGDTLMGEGIRSGTAPLFFKASDVLSFVSVKEFGKQTNKKLKGKEPAPVNKTPFVPSGLTRVITPKIGKKEGTLRKKELFG